MAPTSLFELDPPHFVMDPWPFPDGTPRGASFETVAAHYVDARTGADAAILAAPNTVLEGGEPDNEGAYTRTIAPADALAASEGAAGVESAAVTFTGDNDESETLTLGGS